MGGQPQPQVHGRNEDATLEGLEARMDSSRTEAREAFQKDIRQAAQILKEAGCTGIYLFGSAAKGQVGHTSDIDLAIQGCPKGSFFHLLGKLLLELDHSVDLVNLDGQDAFAQYLLEEGELFEIG